MKATAITPLTLRSSPWQQFGHVYFICNIAKNKEQYGKNFYSSLSKKDKDLRPWPTVSDEIKEKMASFFVSKMCRHSATGQGHNELDRKKGKIPITRDNVTGGKAKSLGNMFRFDVFQDKNGEYSIIPVYAIDLHGYKHECKDSQGNITYKTKEEILNEEEENKKFIFSLYKDDYISVKIKKEADLIKGYTNQYNASSGQLYINSTDDSYEYQTSTSTFSIGEQMLYENEIWTVQSFNKEMACLEIVNPKTNEKRTLPAEGKTTKKGEASKSFKTSATYIKLSKEKKVNYTVIEKIRKYQVDPLGHCVEVKSEKRLALAPKSNALRHREKQAKRQNKGA